MNSEIEQLYKKEVVAVTDNVRKVRDLLKTNMGFNVLIDVLKTHGEVIEQGTAFDAPSFNRDDRLTYPCTISDVDLVLMVPVDTDFDSMLKKIKSAMKGAFHIEHVSKNLVHALVNELPLDLLVVKEHIDMLYPACGLRNIKPSGINFIERPVRGLRSIVPGGINFIECSRWLMSIDDNYVQLAIAILRKAFPDSMSMFWKIGSFFVELKLKPKHGLSKRKGLFNLLICFVEFCNYVNVLWEYLNTDMSDARQTKVRHYFALVDGVSPFRLLTKKHWEFVMQYCGSVNEWMEFNGFCDFHPNNNFVRRFMVPRDYDVLQIAKFNAVRLVQEVNADHVSNIQRLLAKKPLQ